MLSFASSVWQRLHSQLFCPSSFTTPSLRYVIVFARVWRVLFPAKE